MKMINNTIQTMNQWKQMIGWWIKQVNLMWFKRIAKAISFIYPIRI